MSQELINPQDLINQGVGDNSVVDANLPSGIQFLPNLNVAYALSKAVSEKGIAKPGEFVLGGQSSLGKEIEVIALDYRRRAGYQKKDWSYEAEIFHFSNQGDVRENAEYQSFIKNCPQDLKGVDGADLLLFLPERMVFCTMFMKGTLYKFANPIMNSGIGGRVLNLSTSKVEGTRKAAGKTWYDIVTVKTNRAAMGSKLEGVEASVEMPADKLGEAVKLWRNPSAASVTDEKVEEVAR